MRRTPETQSAPQQGRPETSETPQDAGLDPSETDVIRVFEPVLGAAPCPRCKDFIENGNRLWCVRRYNEGGCGAYWTRKSAHDPWKPA